jgi:hypothetical protein
MPKIRYDLSEGSLPAKGTTARADVRHRVEFTNLTDRDITLLKTFIDFLADTDAKNR